VAASTVVVAAATSAEAGRALSGIRVSGAAAASAVAAEVTVYATTQQLQLWLMLGLPRLWLPVQLQQFQSVPQPMLSLLLLYPLL
jgi:hypothetical protein